MSLGVVEPSGRPASLAVRRRDRTLLAVSGGFAVVALVLDLAGGTPDGATEPGPRLAAAAFAFVGGLAITLAAWDRSRRDEVRRRPLQVVTVAAGILWFGQAVGYLLTAWRPGEFDMRCEAIPLLLGLPVAAYPLLSICWPTSMTPSDIRVAVADSLITVLALVVVWWQVVVPQWVYQPGLLGWEQLDQVVMFWALAMALVLGVLNRRIGSLPFAQIALLLGGLAVHLLADTFGQVSQDVDGLSVVSFSVVGYVGAGSLVVAFAHRPAVELEGVASLRAREWLAGGIPAGMALLAGASVLSRVSGTDAVEPLGFAGALLLWSVLLGAVLLSRVAASFELRRAQAGAVEMLLAERTREGWFRALVGDSTEYVFVVDALGAIVYASPRVERDVALHDVPQPFDREHRHLLSDVLVGVTPHEVQLLLAAVSIDAARSGPYDLQVHGHDHVVRDVSLLVRPITDVEFQGFVVTARDVSDARRLQRQIDSSFRQDTLTSLLSRDALLLSLRRQLDAPDLHDAVAVVVLDLERFTALNDTLGRDTGDDILVAVAQSFEHLPGAVRAAARLSGDAFAWMLVASDIELAVAECVDQCRTELRGLILRDGRETEVAFRAGYVVVDENPDRTADWYLEAADLALARSRSARHALLVGYHDQLREETERRVVAEQRLRSALAEGRLEMYYQPVVQLADSRVTGAEALMRLRDRDGTIVPPSEFIALAEEIGLAGELGVVALRAACSDTALASEEVGRDLYVSVNVSADQLVPELVGEVVAALEQSGLAADHLTLEITETVLADRSPRTQRLLGNLRAIGVTISLDDFGTGYSSMSYLATLPVNGIKIDRSFVSVMGTSTQGLTLARLVVQLARSLDLRTVAEGIETVEQVDLLRGMGCDYGQGFLFARPMPFPDYVAALRGSVADSGIVD